MVKATPLGSRHIYLSLFRHTSLISLAEELLLLPQLVLSDENYDCASVYLQNSAALHSYFKIFYNAG